MREICESLLPLISARHRQGSAALIVAAGLFSWCLPLLSAPSLGPGQVIEGTARVVDGDTLDLLGERVRLEGIDAPEHGQMCGRGLVGTVLRTWACGKAAIRHLQDLIAGREVQCHGLGRDTYGRLLAQCFVNGEDINARMVRDGLAWAFIKYSRTYLPEEGEARLARAGVWQGDSDPPWVYRASRWQSAEAAAPSGCAIKGNVSANGPIYHMPWSPWYAKVRIDASKGERWFCSEEEALGAGWRPAAH